MYKVDFGEIFDLREVFNFGTEAQKSNPRTRPDNLYYIKPFNTQIGNNKQIQL